VESTRGLGWIELWEDSLQRWFARRGKLSRTPPESYRLRPEGPFLHGHPPLAPSVLAHVHVFG
jgi:hypothetical protein